MTKLLETYMIPKIGAVNIFKEEEKEFNSFFESVSEHSLILTGCRSRNGARRAAEGYLNAIYFNELNNFCSHITEGWIRQFQTYPDKKNKKSRKK